jgi:hypothetical protein
MPALASGEDGQLESVSRGRRLIATKIPSNSLLLLTLTNIQTPPSRRPTAENITYTVTTKLGKPLEYYYTPLNFNNTNYGPLNVTQAGISPNWWEKNRTANYTVQFAPLNFEQNMKIEIYISPYVTIPQDWNNTCKGLIGVDRNNLTCEVDWYNRTITITDAFVTRDVRPDVIKIVIEGLVNPV